MVLMTMMMVIGSSQVKITEAGLEAIVDLSGGDMRKAVTAMQSASQFYAGEEVGPSVGKSVGWSVGAICKRLNPTRAWEKMSVGT